MKNSYFITSQPDTTYIDRNYTTGNIFIRIVMKRLLMYIGKELSEIDAKSALGLEVGCGEGNIINYLKNQKIIEDIVAIDLQPEKLKFANYNVPHAYYMVSNICQLMFKDNSFDYIIAVEIFEHLSKPILAMKELARVAKSSAYLLISVPYEPYFHWGNLLRGKYISRKGKTPAHVNYWNIRQFKKFLNEKVIILKEHFITTFPFQLYVCQFPKKCKKIDENL